MTDFESLAGRSFFPAESGIEDAQTRFRSMVPFHVETFNGLFGLGSPLVGRNITRYHIIGHAPDAGIDEVAITFSTGGQWVPNTSEVGTMTLQLMRLTERGGDGATDTYEALTNEVIVRGLDFRPITLGRSVAKLDYLDLLALRMTSDVEGSAPSVWWTGVASLFGTVHLTASI